MKAFSALGRPVRILVCFRLVAALATSLLAVAAIVDRQQVVGWYYGWVVLWVSALPSWAVVGAALRNELAIKIALLHDLVLLWAAIVVLPGLPNTMGVLILWFLGFFYIEGLVLMLVRRSSARRRAEVEAGAR